MKSPITIDADYLQTVFASETAYAGFWALDDCQHPAKGNREPVVLSKGFAAIFDAHD
ncbi:MAG: hypothetical protein ACYCY7_01345 [Gallionella sp.]